MIEDPVGFVHPYMPTLVTVIGAAESYVEVTTLEATYPNWFHYETFYSYITELADGWT